MSVTVHRGVLTVGTVAGLLLGVTVAGPQNQPPLSLPDQLTLCHNLLRIKQDVPCRCDQVEQMAAMLLKRAEQAEKDLGEMTSRATKAEEALAQRRSQDTSSALPPDTRRE